MRSAIDYIDGQTGSWLDEFERPVMRLDDALAAVQAALDDAENYRNLLLRAIRHSTPSPLPDEPTSGQLATKN